MQNLFEILLVAVGGGCGSLSRYGVGALFSDKLKRVFPVGTFMVNIIGAFLLGYLTAMHPQNDMKLLFGDGFLGAFTTFSAFMLEGESLTKQGRGKSAAIYISASLLLGVLGFAVGTWI